MVFKMFLKILEDKDVAWFLTLVKDQCVKYSLIAHVVNMLLDVSIGSSSSIVEADL